MASTRTNLTAAFVGGLIAVSGILGLTLWAVRNASVYRDIARQKLSAHEELLGRYGREQVLDTRDDAERNPAHCATPLLSSSSRAGTVCS